MSHEAFLKFLASASLHATLEHAWQARDAEVADLQRQLDNERARGIHSCHANCSRDGCVNRRLRATLDEAVAALKGLHHVCTLALAGKDGRQYAYFESRAGHFVEASGVMQEAEATLAKLGGTT